MSPHAAIYRETPEVDWTVTGLRLGVFTMRNFVFLTAVLAMNFTLFRPSPVDLLYVASFLITIFLLMIMKQHVVTRRFAVFAVIVGAWSLSFLVASLPHLSQDNVIFELISKIFAVTIGITAAFVSMSWTRRHFESFMKVYIVSCVIGAILGTIGYLLQIELLTWDGRAKGLIDDPNMYGSFLIPALIFCAYFLFRAGSFKLWYLGAMAFILLAILLSFSRIALVAALLCLLFYIVFHNRWRPRRLVLAFATLAGIGVLFLAYIGLSSGEFTERLLERLTFAQSYDLGEHGRYNRYLLVLPMIVENPLGLGVLQLEKIFPEPIHNIWLSSFVNYGWGGGIAWIVLVWATTTVAIRNYRRTANETAIVMLVSLIGVIMCATLHEGEHWRQMWLLFGLIWGLDIINFGGRRSSPPPLVPHRP